MPGKHGGIDPAAPHNIDHLAYSEGTPRNAAIAALEAQDPFWKTLGGSTADPFGFGDAIAAERQLAFDRGLGHAIYRPMGYAKGGS